ncbi:MAG: phosphoenolpyruvate synthase [Chroococcidiopsidaceae cyanobacterium CP_BM_RX_35]|nr:phosphoenolpyruvate synthase [Chroococcidiopsidaceae cyanobacterium CP_BM_RX_35]
MQQGYPMLTGFVVSAQVYCEFLETLNSTEPLIADLPHSYLHLDVDNSYQLQQVAQRLRQEITTATLPSKLVDSIRAATEGWETPALMFSPSLMLPTTAKMGIKTDGLLEVQVCSSDKEAIALTLKQVWSQMFRARSLLVWQQAGIGIQQIKLAVLVQPCTNAIASGLLTRYSGELKIQATWGMETSIVQGEVIPDSYYIQAETGVVHSRQLGNKTLAYNLIDSPSRDNFSSSSTALLPQTISSYLQAYLLSEAQQQQYALAEEHLQQLIQLGQKLSSELGTNFALKWTIPEVDGSKAPKPYIIQVDPTAPPAPPPFLIKGLAAAGGQVVAPAYVIAHPSQKPESLPPKVILVAPAITPDWLPLLQQSTGVVTEHGGLTSHSAILAREIGIPAVVSATDATQLIQTGESLLLDGNRGEVYRAGAGEGYDQAKSSLLLGIEPTGYSSVPIATQLYVNLSQIDSLLAVRGLPVDGVGLLRSELMALAILEGQHPHTWLQQGRKAELIGLWQEQINQFVRTFAPRPVFYRSWDWRAAEFPSFKEETSVKEAATHSLLGQRGTLSYVQDSTIFELELAALKAVQQSGYTNLHLILPFVRTVEEFSFCRRLVEQAGLTRVAQFQLWLMAEVPSILFLLPEYVRAGAQGVSIGTNDLTQLLLGVNRDQGQLVAMFDERHPVVRQAIAQVIQQARQANIPCSICGQAPALYPELIDALVRCGITSISVEVDALLPTHMAIVRAEKRLLLEAARRQLGIDQ